MDSDPQAPAVADDSDLFGDITANDVVLGDPGNNAPNVPDPVVDPSPDPDASGDSPEAAENNSPPQNAPTPDPEPPPVDFLESLNSGSSRSFTNVDEVVAALKIDPLSTLGPLAQQVHTIEQSGQDVKSMLRSFAQPYESMEGLTLLKHKWIKDNPTFSNDEQLADMLFQKEYGSKYGALSLNFVADPEMEPEEIERERLAFDAAHKSDKDLAQRLLDHNVKGAKDELLKWQSDLMPKAKKVYSDDEALKIVNQHNAAVDEALSNFKGADIKFNEEADPYKLGVNDNTRKVVEGWLKNPWTLLAEIGIDVEGGGADIEKLLPLAALYAEAKHGHLGTRISDYTKSVAALGNVNNINSTVDNPAEHQNPTHVDNAPADIWDALGQAGDAKFKKK